MIATVAKKFKFEAAHQIDWHKNADGTPGKCSNLHGHSYHGMAYARGHTDELGWVKDFHEMGADLKEVVEDRFDHKTLNHVHPFGVTYWPTTENVAAHILRRLFAKDPRYCMVVLEETDTTKVIVEIEDLVA